MTKWRCKQADRFVVCGRSFKRGDYHFNATKSVRIRLDCKCQRSQITLPLVNEVFITSLSCSKSDGEQSKNVTPLPSGK